MPWVLPLLSSASSSSYTKDPALGLEDWNESVPESWNEAADADPSYGGEGGETGGGGGSGVVVGSEEDDGDSWSTVPVCQRPEKKGSFHGRLQELTLASKHREAPDSPPNAAGSTGSSSGPKRSSAGGHIFISNLSASVKLKIVSNLQGRPRFYQ